MTSMRTTQRSFSRVYHHEDMKGGECIDMNCYCDFWAICPTILPCVHRIALGISLWDVHCAWKSGSDWVFISYSHSCETQSAVPWVDLDFTDMTVSKKHKSRKSISFWFNIKIQWDHKCCRLSNISWSSIYPCVCENPPLLFYLSTESVTNGCVRAWWSTAIALLGTKLLQDYGI